MTRELWCTVGPASRLPGVVERLEDLGVSLFRINLSHTGVDELPGLLRSLAARTKVPLCLDTEGAQVRTGDLIEPTVELEENASCVIRSGDGPGDAASFCLNPHDVVERLEVGDLLSIDFNAALVQVVERGPGTATLRVVNGGLMGRNKAVTLMRELALPALTVKDRAALKIGAELGLRHIALSFANRPEDVDEIRAVFGRPAFVISKIECVRALRNLDAIIKRSDAIVIDRGDLSREVPIERIPRLQKRITARARELGSKVYVATNLLETMVTSPQPTRAEVNDVFNTLADGADGLVLAAETAVGEFPIQCASMIRALMYEFESENGASGSPGVSDDPFSLLVEPHGGRLVQRQLAPEALDDLDRLPRLAVGLLDLLEVEQIATGTYSPIAGFMTRATLESVLAGNRLPDGTLWTMPIVLQVGAREAGRLAAGDRVGLTGEDGTLHALLDVAEVYRVDLEQAARQWFGTTSRAHPGVARLIDRGDTFVGGGVTLVQRLPSPYRLFTLTPAQTRLVFAHKGWSRVLGFHTRNVCHRVHEFIQLRALAETHSDGLFISPVIGPKKEGDFLPGPIMRSYEVLLGCGDVYPPGKVVLGSFATFSRYAGPREAVFTALCRKNMGCSHFILGRDHTGVGDFYPADANRRLFEQLGDLGITPVFSEAVGYHPPSRSYRTLGSAGTLEPISGTRMRQALRNGDELPDWFIRTSIQEMLRAEIAAGRPVFVS